MFEEDTWGRRVSSISHGPGAFDDVWSVDALDDFLSNTPRRPLVRVVQNGSPIDPARYTGRRRLGGGEFSDAVDASKVAELFDGGATIVAQSLHRTSTPVRHFVDDLSREVFHPVQANSYLTPPDSQGLSPHADRHDVFVVQVYGTKEWELAETGSVELTDGDVLYIPAGTEHQARSTDRSSLHLTIGLIRTTYRSLVERALRDCHGLDDPLPLRTAHVSSLSSTLRDRFEDAARALREVDIDRIEEEAGARRRRRVSASGSVAGSIAVLEIDADSTIRRRVEWTVRHEGDCVVVDTDSQSLRAPLSCDPAIRQIDRGDPVLVGDLIGLDPSSRCVLARRLVAAGLCSTVRTASRCDDAGTAIDE